jgi:signal peptidase II
MTPWRRVAIIVTAIVVADQVTKTWALNGLGNDRIIEVFWTLRFNLAFNTGMAFARGSTLGPVIGVVSLAVVVALLFSLRRPASTWRVVASATVVGGALGNIIDRMFRNEGWMRGAVVDFIDLQWWPIFNIADIAIVVGGATLALTLSREVKR